ncbi:MAG TPA: hypothetical protein VFL76_09145 [Edaphocola sp.]|nr:hypothetical protein [Edaphocola sp.]
MDRAVLIIIVASFVWAGFMSAISFMESWLKFKTPGLEVPLGLSIGRLIFKGLNRVEWAFCLIIWLSSFLLGFGRMPMSLTGIYLLLTAFLFLQAFWLLPAMSKRVEARMKGETLPPSSLHFWYVGMEMIKAITLIFAGFYLMRML